MCSLSKAACLRIDDSPAKLKKYNLNQQLEPVKLFQNDQMMTLVSWTRSNRSNCKIIYDSEEATTQIQQGGSQLHGSADENSGVNHETYYQPGLNHGGRALYYGIRDG